MKVVVPLTQVPLEQTTLGARTWQFLVLLSRVALARSGFTGSAVKARAARSWIGHKACARMGARGGEGQQVQPLRAAGGSVCRRLRAGGGGAFPSQGGQLCLFNLAVQYESEEELRIRRLSEDQSLR